MSDPMDDYDELLHRINGKLTNVPCPDCRQFTLTAERRLVMIPGSIHLGGFTGTQPVGNAQLLPVLVCPCGFSETPNTN